MKQTVQKVHYTSPVPFLWSVLLGVPSLFYLIFISFKNAFYKFGILKSKKVNAKVICVGNLTTGGVGKTPITCALANYLAAQGKKVAILSRGYGGKLDNKQVNVVKDYEKFLIEDAALCGDEPYLIAQTTQNTPVLTCRDRVKAAEYAIENFRSEILLLDDGFSNRKIHKDINILAVDARKKFGNSFVLPLGPLREPIIELKRAQKIVLVDKTPSRLPDSSINTEYLEPEPISPEIEKEIIYFETKNLPVYLCKMIKDKYYNALTQEEFTPEELPRAVAFCAIGQPKQFYDYLRHDFNVISTHDFVDHYMYEEKDIKKLSEEARKLGAFLLTTEKDAVKIVPILKQANITTPVLVLKLKPELDIKGLVF